MHKSARSCTVSVERKRMSSLEVTLAQSFAQVIKIGTFLLLKISFHLLVDCVVEKRKSQDLSACSISCGLNLMWRETEVTIIKPGEHGGRDKACNGAEGES